MTFLNILWGVPTSLPHRSMTCWRLLVPFDPVHHLSSGLCSQGVFFIRQEVLIAWRAITCLNTAVENFFFWRLKEASSDCPEAVTWWCSTPAFNTEFPLHINTAVIHQARRCCLILFSGPLCLTGLAASAWDIKRSTVKKFSLQSTKIWLDKHYTVRKRRTNVFRVLVTLFLFS